MQFKKLDFEQNQRDIWEKTLVELGKLNDWIDRVFSTAFGYDSVNLAVVVQSHNDLVEVYEHCKEIIEHRYDKDIADLPFLQFYHVGFGFHIVWRFINTKDDDVGWMREKLIEGAKYDGFDSFYLIEVPLTDSVKTQLDNFRWIDTGYSGPWANEIVTEHDEPIPVLLGLTADNPSDVKVIYTHKVD